MVYILQSMNLIQVGDDICKFLNFKVPIAGELINIWIKGQNLRVGFKKKKV